MWNDVFKDLPGYTVFARDTEETQADAVVRVFQSFLRRGGVAAGASAATELQTTMLETTVSKVVRAWLLEKFRRDLALYTRQTPADGRADDYAFLRIWMHDVVSAVRCRTVYPSAISWSTEPPTEILHMCCAVEEGGRMWYKQIYHADPLVTAPVRNLSMGPGKVYNHDANQQWKTTRHYGQRKLLMSEIEFLTLHARANDTIVYAGAAPGTHIPFLNRMFRALNLTFVLVDPAFADAGHTPAGCECIADFFETGRGVPLRRNDAAYWAGRADVLFISDIRLNTSEPGHAPSSEDVDRDMELQLAWVDAMRPRAGMLKFRLPWLPRIVQYIPGFLKLPVWGGQRTTECRLIFELDAVRKNGVELYIQPYDSQDYERAMYHFNTETRVSRYPNMAAGSCQCYDCAAETSILGEFVDKHEGTGVDRPGRVAALRGEITEDTGQDPALCAQYNEQEVVRQLEQGAAGRGAWRGVGRGRGQGGPAGRGGWQTQGRRQWGGGGRGR